MVGTNPAFRISNVPDQVNLVTHPLAPAARPAVEEESKNELNEVAELTTEEAVTEAPTTEEAVAEAPATEEATNQ